MDRPPEEVLPMLARAHLDPYNDPAMVRLLRISLSESALNPGVRIPGSLEAKRGRTRAATKGYR